MAEHYQVRIAGDPDWTPGRESYAEVYANAWERLHFHHGAGFRLAVDGGTPGPIIRLADVGDRVKSVLASHPLDTTIRIASVADGYSLLMRRHKVAPTVLEKVAFRALELVGTPYSTRVPPFQDCSWYSMTVVAEAGVTLPHNAHEQHLDTSVVIPIPAAKVKRWDLAFIHDDAHVALVYEPGLTVYDTEPDNADAPPGWETPMLGTGVRKRPMTGNYYCANVNAYGRIPAINGNP